MQTLKIWKCVLAVWGVVSVLVVDDARAVEQSGDVSLERQEFKIDGQPAFLILPEKKLSQPTPWVLYAPSLGGDLPGSAEAWMFRQWLAAGIAVAGVNVGESFGSPAGRSTYNALHQHLVNERGFAPRACLLARSRGGLMLYAWAIDNGDKVNCVAGIYPVCNIASYPGVKAAAGAYGLTETKFAAELAKHNPTDRIGDLAKFRVPIYHIHGDVDTVVPIKDNTALLAQHYKAAGGEITVQVAEGQGHNMWRGFFECQPLVDFVTTNALAKAPPKDD